MRFSYSAQGTPTWPFDLAMGSEFFGSPGVETGRNPLFFFFFEDRAPSGYSVLEEHSGNRQALIASFISLFDSTTLAPSGRHLLFF